MFKERMTKLRPKYTQAMTSIKRTVLIYAKPPVMGMSKTRLADGLGAAEAQRIARWTFERTLRAAIDTRWRTILATTPDSYLNATLGGLWPKSLERMSQGSGDLTARLNKGLAKAPPGKVVFIGADCPDISSALIGDAFEELSTSNAVFGPARDGGFWLFGINKRAQTASPFENVRWSTKYALGDVRDNLFGTGSITYLPELIDIDTAEDWYDWRGGQSGELASAPPKTAPAAEAKDPPKRGLFSRLRRVKAKS